MVTDARLQYQGGTDPNALQHKASDPTACVWVGASAGTGKTKVLTDRVLRLLLPRNGGEMGSLPHKILCLTFTKAAASEMALRISKKLAKWAVMDGGKLEEALIELLGAAPSDAQMAAARKLFASVVDVPGGLKIMTIHSFCQSVLGRFPLEAGLTPNFTVMEEFEAREFLHEAQGRVFAALVEESFAPQREALNNVARCVNEDQFAALLKSFVSDRHQFLNLLERRFGIEGLYAEICSTLDVQPNLTPEEMLRKACVDDAFPVFKLREIARIMIDQGSKTDQERGTVLAHWLSLDAQMRIEYFETYKLFYLKQEGDIRATLCGKKVSKILPDMLGILLQEAERVSYLQEQMNAAQIAVLTRDLCALSGAVIECYEDLKAQRGKLDFDDLIFKTLALLRGRTGDKANSAWVQYKLDQGLDHILVDEAQDTNPEQWQIVEALCDDFFSGLGAREEDRSIFVVGDEKQSIYSFQRASPEEFERMRKSFAEKVEQAQRRWQSVDMDMSFRSVRSVLSCVDAVFNDDQTRKGLGQKALQHFAHRENQAGLVELWPLYEADEVPEKGSLWDVPVDVQTQQSAAQKAADDIADRIERWIKNGDILRSHGRSIQAGDIMILVRKRGSFVALISKALKTRGIAVSGLDRMILGEQLAVQDMVAAAKFALLPADDLSLACFLKSPFIGLSEEDLFDLAYDREAELWLSVQRKASPEVIAYLRALLQASRSSGPFDFMNWLLRTACPADTVSGRRAIVRRLGTDALDALDEFLNKALEYQLHHVSSLQHFVFAQERESTEIKREQDEAASQVRIMTVHGSKGLQAPIVILPDTTSSPKMAANRADNKLLWPSQTGLSVPLWSPAKDYDCAGYSAAWAAVEARMDDEYRRLLYVAMTRAEDRLYVAGIKGKYDLPENCWYRLVERGLHRCEDVVELEGGGFCLAHGTSAETDRKDKDYASRKAEGALPAWLYVLAPDESGQVQDILQPSKMAEIALSPVSDQNQQRFLRGNLTHKLLQILPELPLDGRAQAAQRYIGRYGSVFSEDLRADIVAETLKVLDHPEFGAIFGEGSRAEVPISGKIVGKGGVVSGQIDRLLVREKDVLIVDFKTNRPPPMHETDIPASYRLQLAAYADILKDVYPDKIIRTALLWTDGPHLMAVNLSESLD